MDTEIAVEFLELINSLINQRISSLSKVILCQIVSDDVGSGLYNVRIDDTEDRPSVMYKDILNSTPCSFKNGDSAYLLIIGGDMTNAVIIAPQKPKPTNSAQENTVNNTTIINNGTSYEDGDTLQY